MRVIYLSLLLFALICLIICSTKYKLENLFVFSDEYVISSHDGLVYVVRGDFTNKKDAARILGEINDMFVRVIKHLKHKNSPETDKWAGEIKFLTKNFNPDVLGEHIPVSLTYTSYVKGKGDKIRMCLRLPHDKNNFHDMNTLKFVALHELSHMAVRTYGHDKEFWNFFRFLLLEAASIGEIELVDYRKYPKKYCGIDITNNPAFNKEDY